MTGTTSDRGGRRRSWRRVTPGAALVTLAAVVVAVLSARNAAVLVTASRYPAIAAKLAPANATAITHVFDKTVLTPEGLRQDIGPWRIAAKQALRADPLNASGIRLFAYITELIPENSARARALMNLSERVSRRDVLAQLWLIEDSVRHGNVAGALQHYDRALSTRPAVAGQLFPIMMAAISEPAIREGLVPYLRANRAWASPFLSVVAARSPDVEAATDLFQRYGGSRIVPSHAVYETELLRRLVSAGKVNQAQAFAVAIGAGTTLDRFGFTPATIAAHFRPLTWSLYDGFEGDVSLKNGGLRIAVRPEVRIVAATRTIPPPSSVMTLTQRISYPDVSAAPAITWKAYCRRLSESPQQFWARDLPVAAAPATIQASIDVPKECVAVQIDIEAAGATGSTDSKVVIDRVGLTAH